MTESSSPKLLVTAATFDLIQACLDASEAEGKAWTIRKLASDRYAVDDSNRAIGPNYTLIDPAVAVLGSYTRAHFDNKDSAVNFVNHHVMAAALNRFMELSNLVTGSLLRLS